MVLRVEVTVAVTGLSGELLVGAVPVLTLNVGYGPYGGGGKGMSVVEVKTAVPDDVVLEVESEGVLDSLLLLSLPLLVEAVDVEDGDVVEFVAVTGPTGEVPELDRVTDMPPVLSGGDELVQ